MDNQNKLKGKKLKKEEDKTGYCLELKMTGIHAITYIPCPECNRSVSTFIATPNALVRCGTQQCVQVGECVCGKQVSAAVRCGTLQCQQVGECVCGQQEIDDQLNMDKDELDQVFF